jgi:hypothetical protein
MVVRGDAKANDRSDTWRTPADAGWRAAAAASAPTHGGVTHAGLPKRTPKANLVPGSVTAVTPSTTDPRPIPPPTRSAEQVRNRMSSFQQGVRRGRQEARHEASRDRAEEEESS